MASFMQQNPLSLFSTLAKSVHVILSLHTFYIVIHILKWVKKTAKKLYMDTDFPGRDWGLAYPPRGALLSSCCLRKDWFTLGRTVSTDSLQRILLTLGLGARDINDTGRIWHSHISELYLGRCFCTPSDLPPSLKVRWLTALQLPDSLLCPRRENAPE